MPPFDAQPPSPFPPTHPTSSTPKKEPPPFPSPEAKTTSDQKGLEQWMKLLGPGATIEQAEKFRSQTMQMSTDFIKNRMAKMRENAKKNERLGLYGEY